MNEIVKRFIKEVNANEDLRKQFIKLNEKIGEVTDRDEVIKQHVLPFAKTCGYDLTIEDFSADEGEIDEAELQSVNGGSGGCGCPAAGGGSGIEDQSGESFGCGCVMCGTGFTDESSYDTCFCFLVGGGTD